MQIILQERSSGDRRGKEVMPLRRTFLISLAGAGAGGDVTTNGTTGAIALGGAGGNSGWNLALGRGAGLSGRKGEGPRKEDACGQVAYYVLSVTSSRGRSSSATTTVPPPLLRRLALL